MTRSRQGAADRRARWQLTSRSAWATVLLVALVLIGVAGWLTARRADLSLRAQLLLEARTVASMIHVEHVGLLRGGAEDLETADYQLLKESLARVRSADRQIRFIYLMGQASDGHLFFYADSEPPDSPDYSPPGQVYERPSAEFRAAFREAREGTEGPLRDAWGTWVSAFVPLAVPAGASPAVLGMDVDARAWTRTVVGQAALPASAIAVSVLLAFLVARLLQANREVRKRGAELRESFQTSADIVRTIPAGLYIYQYAPPDRLILLGGNAEAERITGLHAEDWLGCELDEIWPDSRRTGVKKTYLIVMQTGEPFVRDGLLHEDERVAGAFRVRAFPLPRDRLAVAFEDVSDQVNAERRVRELLSESNEARAALLSILEDEKRAEESLRRSEAKFAAAFRTSPYALTITRARDGQFIDVNDAFTTISGYAREAALENSSIGLKLWVNEEDRWQVAREVQSGQSVVGREILFRRENGQVLTGLFSAQMIQVGDEPCILSSIDDITHRKRAEAERQRLQEQLAQSQKMEYVGRLAGGIAHDFNNLLMGIMSYVELCRDRIDEEPVRGWLDEITRDARRSADLTRQLLAFARRQTIAPVILDLNVVLPATLRMLRRLVGEDIDIVWRPGAETMQVKIDPSQLDQILMNLAVNARDAIGGAGKLSLETARAAVDARRAGPAQVSPGEYVELIVTDDGAGMSREVLEHIFEPFYTTKMNGEGTGLGLATVYGIVRQNGGFIEVVSTPGQGTTFRICLPADTGPSPEAPGGTETSALPRGHETVLVVEDEKSIRVALEQFLMDLGYAVLVAPAADVALEAAARHEGSIDLLITDVVMPGMSGRALAERLKLRRPDVRCLFISGYTADVIATRGVLDARVDFLAKPFTRDELAHKVRQILDR